MVPIRTKGSWRKSEARIVERTGSLCPQIFGVNAACIISRDDLCWAGRYGSATSVVDDGPRVAQLAVSGSAYNRRKGHRMPTFIKLKDEDGAEVAVNVDMITKVVPGTDDELTEVYLLDEEDALEVEDSIEEILAKVKAAP